MLQIQDINKEYITGELHQTALDHVSLNLRDNEFVAILGPSGSGKTTLLNIIGGLDRYDSGNLIINGISTKQYKDRDWDSYRNHTIGFVFQSYNLIPHQTVLANVELALTISGISKRERRKRAISALSEVGLGDQLHKKPNQMSGGQMQRVAIARALVNNPDIVLADEPTGALDTETSVQVMELLKEVAKNRLVVMVTHNPELAEQYATRIVRLRDGRIIDDSEPYTVNAAELEEPQHKNMGKSSMSFLTSLALSFNNLRTKKGRTFLTAFAGSIGIIGIALILSLSNGANTYIQSIEEETLSEYPLTIQSTNMDLTSLMEQRTREAEETEPGTAKERQTVSALFSRVRSNDLQSLREYLIEDHEEIDEVARAVEYTYSVTPQIYRINEDGSYRKVNPDQALSQLTGSYSTAQMMMSGMNAFDALPEETSLYQSQYDVLEGRWPENRNECVLILTAEGRVTDLALYAMGLKDTDELDAMIEAFMNGEPTDVETEEQIFCYEEFIGKEFRVVDAADCYAYDAEYGVYVDKTDNTEYMRNLIQNGEPLTVVGVVRPNEDSSVSMLGNGLYYPASLTEYVMEASSSSEIVQKQLDDPQVNVFTGKRFDEIEENTLDLGSLFAVDEEVLAEAFALDEEALSLDGLDFGNMDLSDLSLDTSGLNFNLSGLGNIDLSSILQNVQIDVSESAVEDLFQEILSGYLAEAAKDPTTNYAQLGESMSQYLSSDDAVQILRSALQETATAGAAPSIDTSQVSSLLSGILSGFPAYLQANGIQDADGIEGALTDYLNSAEVQSQVAAFAAGLQAATPTPEVSEEQVQQLLSALYSGYEQYASANQLPDPSKLADSFASYIRSDAGQQTILGGVQKAVDMNQIQRQLNQAFAGVMAGVSSQIQQQLTQAMTRMMSSLSGQIASAISSQMSDMADQLSESLQDAFSVDVDTFSNAITFSMDTEQLRELMMSMMSTDVASYEGNLSKLNYADPDSPSAILIYPKDFESKNRILTTLDGYNERMQEEGQDEKVIAYTDYVGTLMSSVTDIVDTISYVLVAFVAISLIVSSIMIGIITYISVLERTKEIGILRAIGASKRNISQVFNAETFIIGLLAGVLGIGIALLLLIPINALIHSLAGNTNISAILPPAGAVILIVISVLLTLIGGLIPSRKAAKKDPVTALRTE